MNEPSSSPGEPAQPLGPPFRAPSTPPFPPPAAPAPRSANRRAAAGVIAGAVLGVGATLGVVAIASQDDESTTAAATPPTDVSVEVVPASDEPGNSIAALVAEARPSIVALDTSLSQTNAIGQTVEGRSAGSGFVLSADGYVVTNSHVVDGATEITVEFGDGTSADGTVVAADPDSDLAVVKVDRTDLTPLPIGSSSDLQLGEQLVAIGNALDLSGEPTVTTGIVSATGRSISVPGGVRLVDLIQTDAAINPGNSGGPLLNMAGEVVGINTAVAGGAQNVGFAISIDSVRDRIDTLRAGEVPEHALLGVSSQPTEDRDGAEIVSVSEDSAAAAAGLEAGDVITAIDEVTVATPDELGVQIAERRPGDQVEVTYKRDGTSNTAAVVLGARPIQS